MTVINTEKPAVTVDVGGTIKTVQGVNVTINCQVAGENIIYALVLSNINRGYKVLGGGAQREIRHKFCCQRFCLSRKVGV